MSAYGISEERVTALQKMVVKIVDEFFEGGDSAEKEGYDEVKQRMASFVDEAVFQKLFTNDEVCVVIARLAINYMSRHIYYDYDQDRWETSNYFPEPDHIKGMFRSIVRLLSDAGIFGANPKLRGLR